MKTGHLRVLVYHGQGRRVSARALAKYDLVITTYGIVSSEVKGALGKDKADKEAKVKMEDMKGAEDIDHVRSNDSELLNVFWERIILDEAHQVRSDPFDIFVLSCYFCQLFIFGVLDLPAGAEPEGTVQSGGVQAARRPPLGRHRHPHPEQGARPLLPRQVPQVSHAVINILNFY